MTKKDILFRFDKPRDQQKQLLEDVFECVSTGKNLIAHAPTGLGKSDASISPALSHTLSTDKKIFFLTPKISQHEIAVEVVHGLNEKHSLSIKAADLVGRKYMCVDPILSDADFSGFYEICARRRKREECHYYNNARGNTKQEKERAKIHSEQILSSLPDSCSHHELRDACLSYESGGKERIPCAYELSLELAKEADIIIADYFHLMNPHIRKIMLSRLKLKPEDLVLIVDEAHNVPERVRSMLGSTLSLYSIEQSINELEKIARPDLIKKLRLVRKQLASLAKKKLSLKLRESLVAPSEFLVDEIDELAEELYESAVNYIESSGKGRSFQMQVSNFLKKWINPEKDSVRIIHSKHSKNISLMVKALDPGIATKPLFGEAYSSILMSGTLLPTKMYADLLGFDDSRTVHREFSSPFPSDRRLNLVATNATTKYGERSEQEYETIASTIQSIVSGVPGNTAVFFPSFALLNSVQAFLDENLSRPILAQTGNMNSRQTSALLKKFRAAGNGFGSVLLAVSQGSFAEGIDYVGEQLLCSIIVGIPLQEMNLELKCLIDHYQEKFARGWHYAYLYPAISRAIQASGRVIRKESDEGVAVFLDKRYTWSNYRNCFPKDFRAVTTDEPGRYTKLFFDQS